MSDASSRHRGSSRNGRLMVLLVSLVLVAIVALVVALVLRHNGSGGGHATGAVHASTSRSASASAAAGSPASAAASAGSAVSSPPASATAAAAPSTSASAISTPSAAPTPSPTAARTTELDLAPLKVLNDSRIVGLAAKAAAAFHGANWQVVEIGNYKGPVVATTTVFYPPAELAAARELVREFPRIKRLIADRTLAADGPMVVVVTRDWEAGN